MAVHGEQVMSLLIISLVAAAAPDPLAPASSGPIHLLQGSYPSICTNIITFH